MSFLSCCPDMKSQAGRWVLEGQLAEDAAARLGTGVKRRHHVTAVQTALHRLAV